MEKGERIRLRREALGMTQTELADALSTTKQNIYKYENGIISNIPFSTLGPKVPKIPYFKVFSVLFSCV